MPHFKNACHILTETREVGRSIGWVKGSIGNSSRGSCAVGLLSFAIGANDGAHGTYVGGSHYIKGLVKAMEALARRLNPNTKSRQEHIAKEYHGKTYAALPREGKIDVLQTLIVEGNDGYVNSKSDFFAKLDLAIQDVCLNKGDK